MINGFMKELTFQQVSLTAAIIMLVYQCSKTQLFQQHIGQWSAAVYVSQITSESFWSYQQAAPKQYRVANTEA